MLQPQVFSVNLKVEFAIRRLAHDKSSLGISRKHHVVAGGVVHILLSTGGICVNIILIISCGLEVPDGSFACILCLHIDSVVFHLISEIIVIAIGKVEPFLIAKILCQLIDRCHFLDRDIDGRRPFHDRIGREPIRRKADGISVHLKIIDHIARITSIREVNDPGIFA